MARRNTITARVVSWLLAHPGASNRELYEQFPDVPRSTLRRIAGDVSEVRAERKLSASRGRRISQPLIAKREVLGPEERASRIQLTFVWTLRHDRIRLPLSQDVLYALRGMFAEADDHCARDDYPVELSGFLLVVQIARSARIVRGRIAPDWSKPPEFISIPSTLRRARPRQLWDAFEQEVISRVDDTERAEAYIRAGIVSVDKSDPVLMRPAQLKIFVHTPEI